MAIQLTKSRTVDNFSEPYIIAELGANHNGDMGIAAELIRAAKAAGADCVKFQSWTKDSIFSKSVYTANVFLSDDYRNRTDYTLEQMVAKFAVSEADLRKMSAIATTLGIDCISTPFSKREADFLVDQLEVPFLKIASMDVTNLPFLDYVARKRRPIILSTGLSELSDIDLAIRTIEDAGNRHLILLHCVSIYPPEDSQVHLNNIDTLRTMYPYPIGFSDHSLGHSIPLAAVAKGACVIEKHFTLDKSMSGWDHRISADPTEMASICREARRIQRALGTPRIRSMESPERKIAFRRSIVAARDIRSGEVLQEGDIDYKRPGSGYAPHLHEFIVGRVAAKDIPQDKVIQRQDLL